MNSLEIVANRRKLTDFLGPKVTSYLKLGTIVGVTTFAVELAFAYALQAFLVAAGIVVPGAVSLPAWMPQTNLTAVLVFILVVGILRGLMNWLQVYMPSAVQEKFRHIMRARVLRWAFHSESVSTHQATMLFNEWTNNSAALVYSLQFLAVQATSALMILVALLAISFKLTMIVAVAMLMLYPPIRVADRRIVETVGVLVRSLDETSRRMVISIRNLLLIQIYGTQGLEEGRALSALEDYDSRALYHHRLTGFKVALPQVVGVLLICVITLAARGAFKTSPGVLVSYFYLVIRLLQLLSTMNGSVSTVLRNWPETLIVWRWWQEAARGEAALAASAAPAAVPSASGAGPVGWELKDVRFRYPSVDAPVIEGLSLKLSPGQCLVFTGPSGSGKSTLLNLLLGGLVPERGSISVVLADGSTAPLAEFRPRLYPLIGYVGPESLLVEGTIRENLLYGLSREPSAGDFEAALAKAECGFVSQLAGGLEYKITEQGQGLSAGQKQRLSLARAFLRRPKVLVLDEATSNLDQETELRLVQTLLKVKGEMTIVAATHRSALLSIADQRVSLS